MRPNLHIRKKSIFQMQEATPPLWDLLTISRQPDKSLSRYQSFDSNTKPPIHTQKKELHPAKEKVKKQRSMTDLHLLRK